MQGPRRARWVHTRHTLSSIPIDPGYHNHQVSIWWKIYSLLIYLINEPLKYDELAPKIEYVIREGFATVDELVEEVSGVAGDNDGSFASAGRFFKEFHDAPPRSGQVRSSVVQ